MSVTVIGSGNFSGSSAYLPLTGGTLSGDLEISGDAVKSFILNGTNSKGTYADMAVNATDTTQSYSAIDLHNDINQQITLNARNSYSSAELSSTNVARINLRSYDSSGKAVNSVSIGAIPTRGVVSGLTKPIGDKDATNKQYVDNLNSLYFYQWDEYRGTEVSHIIPGTFYGIYSGGDAKVVFDAYYMKLVEVTVSFNSKTPGASVEVYASGKDVQAPDPILTVTCGSDKSSTWSKSIIIDAYNDEPFYGVENSTLTAKGIGSSDISNALFTVKVLEHEYI